MQDVGAVAAVTHNGDVISPHNNVAIARLDARDMPAELAPKQ